MDLKEIATRLEIVKLAIQINDKETIKIQAQRFQEKGDIYLREIAMLLESKNYRQALYLVKKYKDENDIVLEENALETEAEVKNVLNVEDMLKMSPVGKETILEFRRSSYTKDDLESFAKNMSSASVEEFINSEAPAYTIKEEAKEFLEEQAKQETQKEEPQKKEVEQKEKIETTPEAQEAISEASKDTPLDEMSKELSSKKGAKRARVLSKYKTLRTKFSKEKALEAQQEEQAASKERQKDIYEDGIYPPIGHIEEKFRQAFSLYPPIKENDVWVEEVAKFLKFISLNSYKDSDVEKFLDEYFEYKEKGDIAKASQVLLLASATEAKYAQFLLARELFKGKVLKRNVKASLELMTKIANSGYADAICDLGQFYEYGVGVPENKKIALRLYEKAFELGLQRATKHINRIKESSSLLASLKKVFN